MAYIDEYDILCDRQVITKTTYAQRAKALLAPNDWGNLNQVYIQVTALGTFNTAASLTIQVVVADDQKFTKNVRPITQIVGIKQDSIKKNATWYLDIPRTGSKYQYLTLKFVPAGKEADENADLGQIEICPSKPLNQEEPELENGFIAFFTATPSDAVNNVNYPYASDKLRFYNLK